MSPLDEVLALARHRERHVRMVAASRESVWQALLAVTPAELPLRAI